MDIINSKQEKYILSAWLFFIIFFIVISTGYFGSYELSISEIIINKPLPKLYFPFFFVFSLLLPIFSLIKLSKFKLEKELIKYYLKFLGIQIIFEIIFLLISGKGATVIVGLIFSMLRLIQLFEFISIRNVLKSLKLIFVLQFSIWSYNIMQITLNRIIPLVQ